MADLVGTNSADEEMEVVVEEVSRLGNELPVEEVQDNIASGDMELSPAETKEDTAEAGASGVVEVASTLTRSQRRRRCRAARKQEALPRETKQTHTAEVAKTEGGGLARGTTAEEAEWTVAMSKQTRRRLARTGELDQAHLEARAVFPGNERWVQNTNCRDVHSQASWSPVSMASSTGTIRKQYAPRSSGTMAAPAKPRPVEPIPTILLDTNHIQINVNRMCRTAFHYDVQIQPDHAKSYFRQVMERLRMQHFPSLYPAYDGRTMLFSARRLFHDDNFIGEVLLAGSGEESGTYIRFVVRIRYVNTVLLGAISDRFQGKQVTVSKNALRALDMIFRSVPGFAYVQLGRSFFRPSLGDVLPLGGGLQIARGIFQSASLGSSAFLNIDTAHRPFSIEQNVIQLIAELHRCRARQLTTLLPLNLYDTLIEILTGLKITYQLPNVWNSKRIYRVVNVLGCSRSLHFQVNGQTYDVCNYFMERRLYRIRFPAMPCIQVGRLDKPIYLPVELCTVVKNQACHQHHLTETQNTNLMKYTTATPQSRKQRILHCFDEISFPEHIVLRAFGVTISDRMTRVCGRRVEVPHVQYAGGIYSAIHNGVWRIGKFYASKVVERWGLVCLSGTPRINARLRELADGIKHKSCSMGLMMKPCHMVKLIDLESFNNDAQRRAALHAYLSRSKSKYRYEIIFVILPEFQTETSYAMVKQVAELQVGILTQCLASNSIINMYQPLLENILLKVNTKLNGINHILAQVSRPKVFNELCMVVGVDVDHPHPALGFVPNVIGTAASHDENYCLYNTRWSMLPSRIETIADLDDLLVDHLKYFQKKRKSLPKVIIIYRDCISDQIIEKIRREELVSVQRACLRMRTEKTKYTPKISFVLVNKRHHTRFFPVNESDALPNGNVPPGTCVDSVITEPSMVDFYLCSHTTSKGTLRPTRYRVIMDDNKFSKETWCEITFKLCHLYARCSRSVSYPPATYYAHHAAQRARQHVLGRTIQLNYLHLLERECAPVESFQEEYPMFFV